ncbi:endonuclease Q family protein [Pueribacillus theae]|uniref:endonuclease Q family protein n=1 Tax=Pueribacillus theae TaxID=2171751 RepID=UPI00198132C3|nr:endonuclease Q family protein [Pueribacillus theae]
MNHYFADLHIHIGRTSTGRPVKITGAKSLTLENIIHASANMKGMDIVGIIDCHVPEVIDELECLIQKNVCAEHPEGGINFGKVTLFLGSEIEIYDDNCKGPIHVLVFLPTIEKMKRFSTWLTTRMTNLNLSSQRLYEKGKKLQEVIRQLDGLFIPAHVFTPFKSLYGKGIVKTLREVFDPGKIDAVELGLSSNTEMADQIKELHRYPFLTNSDAHSLQKIAREYQKIFMKQPTFEEFKRALQMEDGRGIECNYGLDPKLGKYYRTTCQKCFAKKEEGALQCPVCGHNKWTKGVFERLQELKDATRFHPGRPPYIQQVPLEYIPGIGSKTLVKLRNVFQTEMNILHDASLDDLKKIVPEKTAQLILKARKGELSIQAGGGGKYGKVTQSPS